MNISQTEKQNAFERFRTEFKEKTTEWQTYSGELKPLQEEAAKLNGTPAYPLETQVVYNHALDDVADVSTIKLILIADNPGKEEQLARNQRYLVGQAGKLADGFFRKHPELGISFRENVLILNKTPVHTAKTKELQYVLRNGSDSVRSLLKESQIWMAEKTAALQKALGCPLWLIGYAELRDKGLFTLYRDVLSQEYGGSASADPRDVPVYVFQHFSMNCFSNDLKKNYDDGKSLKDNLTSLGLMRRKDILGF